MLVTHHSSFLTTSTRVEAQEQVAKEQKNQNNDVNDHFLRKKHFVMVIEV